MNPTMGKSMMCQQLSASDLMIREGWSSAFYVGKLPAKYILLDEGLRNLSLYSDVTVLVNESGYQYRICLNIGCHYSVTKRACEGAKAGSKAGGCTVGYLASCLILCCTFLQNWEIF